MQRIIYRSHALVGEYTPDALSILAVAEARNRKDGITGFLHREFDRFCQIIEGPNGATANLLDRLRQDARHAGVQIISRRTCTERAFSAWDMGYSSNHLMKLASAVPSFWETRALTDATEDEVIRLFLSMAAHKPRSRAA